ncbi:MAG: hypothetical protein ACQEUM_07070 [Pseudomonadota bacterium]
MHGIEILHLAAKELRRIGGTDIVIVEGEIYEISARKLDRETVRRAVKNLDEGKRHGHD